MILQIIPSDGSLVQWKQLWPLARRSGIGSKETFTKYLKILVTSGRVLQEENGYRLNPIYGTPFDQVRNPSFHNLSDLWQARELVLTGCDSGQTIKAHLPELLEATFHSTIRFYMQMLTAIAGAPNRAAAQRIFDLFLSNDTFLLAIVARQVWAHRAKPANPQTARIDLRISELQGPLANDPTIQRIRHVGVRCTDCGEEIAGLHQPLYDAPHKEQRVSV